MRFTTFDPSTERALATWTAHTDAEVERRLQRAAQAVWPTVALSERAAFLERLAVELEASADELAVRMASEMGKPLAEGVAEVRKCAWLCRHTATEGPAWLADELHASDGSAAYVRSLPLGPVLGIMPWNFPLWQVLRFAASAWLAGCPVVVKHAPATLGTAHDLEGLVERAGAPPGTFQLLVVGVDKVGPIIDDERVAVVTFTGSSRAGRVVASRAGGALTPCVVEGGGSDPFVVLADADVERAAEVGAKARLLNSGQSCIAAKRFVVHRAVADDFLDAFVAAMGGRTAGDPRDVDSDLGPLARQDLRAALVEQVRSSVRAGAEVVLGGEPPRRTGWFMEPTVLTSVPEDAPAWREELFGPVAAVRVFDDDAALIEAANATVYGLGASVWSGDVERAQELGRRLEVGSVFINGLVKSDPRLPFGGVKASGFGRELGRDGVRSFTNRQTVWVA